MKIALIVTQFPPVWLAGTEIATYNIAKCLSSKGHDVHVITTLDKGLPKNSNEHDFYVHRIPRKISFVGYLSLWTKIFFELRKINPDIAHIQGIGLGIPGYIGKKVLKTPYLVYGRGSDVYLPGKALRLISKPVLKNANAVVALTEDMKRVMGTICKRDIFVVPNGINITGFNCVKLDSESSKRKKTVIFIGRLNAVKGVSYLIRSLSTIKNVYPDIKLLIIGEGEDRDILKSLANDLHLDNNITFVGVVPNKDIPNYMSVADIFVLPSISEGFPNVLLEAMASGLPIVASNVGGVPSIVRNGINGFLVEPKEVNQIADKILLLLNDNALRANISLNNKELVKSYSWDTVAINLESIYFNIVSAGCKN